MAYTTLTKIGATLQRSPGMYSPNNNKNPARGQQRPSLFNYTQLVSHLPRLEIESGAGVQLQPVNEQPKEIKRKAQKDTPLRDRLTIKEVTKLRKVRKRKEKVDLMERKLNKACLKIDKFKKALINIDKKIKSACEVPPLSYNDDECKRLIEEQSRIYRLFSEHIQKYDKYIKKHKTRLADSPVTTYAQEMT